MREEEFAKRKEGKMIKSIDQQGDLLFTTIPNLPKDLPLRSSYLIPQREMTGHRHCLLSDRVFSDAQGALFLEVGRTMQGTHQKYRPIYRSVGCYRATSQREYTPEAIREVCD